MFDGLKMCSPRHWITYFESSETAAVPAKIHQPRRLHQSPCCGAGDAEDEGDAVAGQQRARRPHDHVLAAGRRSRTRAPPQVPSDTRICAIESWKSNADLPDHLQRDDHRREVQARVAQLRQQHRVRRAADARPPAGRAARGRSLRDMRAQFGASRPNRVSESARMKLDRAHADRRARRRRGARPAVGVRRRHARRARRGGDDGRRRPRHPPERAAEGVHGRAQRRALDARARREGRATTRSSARASTRSSRSSSAASPCSRATTRVGAVGVSGLPGEVDEAARARRYRTIRGSVKTSSSRLRVENSDTIAPSGRLEPVQRVGRS